MSFSCYLEVKVARCSSGDYCCARRQQPIEDPTDLNHKEQTQNKSKKNKQSQKRDLTRFGQRAYVLGAINGEICIREDDYNGFCLFQYKRALSLSFSQVRNPRTAQHSIYTRCSAICGAVVFCPNPSIGRPYRSTDPSCDFFLLVSRPLRSTDSHCGFGFLPGRSTGTVDRFCP